MKSLKIYLILIATIIIPVGVSAQQVMAIPSSSGMVSVNEAKIYYEIYGKGKPIILIHGAFMTIDLNWAQLIPELSKTRKVVAVEMQGHGHTPYSERPLSFPVLAKDVTDLMKYLKIDSADIMGYSFGGTIAYQLAIQSPSMVNNLIIVSAPYKTECWQPEVWTALKALKPEFLDQTPLQTAYLKVAADSTKWHPFLAKMMSFISRQYNLGDANIKKITSPVLLLMGDNDGIDKIELARTYQLLGGGVVADLTAMPKSQLAIIPGKSHTSLIMDPQMLLTVINSFLQINN